MIRAFCTLFAALAACSCQAVCLSVHESKPKDWYDWAQVLVAADVTGVSQRGRYDVIALRVVEAYKGPELIETVTLEVPQNFWEVCKIERPKVGARVLGALNANHDANVVPLDAAYAAQLLALRPPRPVEPAPVAAAPAAAAAAESAPAVTVQCVRSPVYGATVKVDSCEQASGALFLRGEIVRAAQENYADDVPGLPVPEYGKKFSFAKPNGQCSDFTSAKNPSITGRLSHPCCDKNQPYCAKKTDFLIDDTR